MAARRARGARRAFFVERIILCLAARIALQVTGITVNDAGTNSPNHWTVDVSVELQPPGGGVFKNGAVHHKVFEEPSVKAGAVLTPKAVPIFECDLTSEKQKIVVTTFGSYEFTQIIGGPHTRPLNRAVGIAPPKLTAPPATTEIPLGEPKSGPFSFVSQPLIAEGGGHSVSVQANTMGYWDLWGNLWEK